MKKFLALLTAIIATLVCFSACGSCVSDNDNSSSSSSGGNEPPVLTKRTADGEIAYIFDEYEGFSYDAPSVIKDGNDVIVAYTTNKTQNKEDKIIAVKKGTFADGKFTFAAQKTAIEPSQDGWDKHNIDNADLVKGEFLYGGESYNYLMVYQANSIASEKRMQIGAAVSKDALSWVKVGDKPLLSYDYESLGDTAGLCYPSVVNVNQKGGIMLFYTRATSLVTETRFVEINAANLNSPVFGGEICIPSSGLPLDGNEWSITVNADFAYDKTSDEIYMVKDGFPYASNNAKKATKIEIAKIAVADLFSQGAKWTTVVSIIDGLDVGYSRVYSAEFVTDGYADTDGQNLALLFSSGVSASDASDESYKFKNGIHYYEVPSLNREDK